MTDQIESKVARILDGHRLILNRGALDGVEVGSRFAVLSPRTVKVTDPDDSTVILGTLPVARTIVKVTSVEERMSIAQTFRTLKSSGILPTFTFGPREWNDSIDTDESTVVEELGTTERTVKLGDVTVEIPGNEDFQGVVLPF